MSELHTLRLAGICASKWGCHIGNGPFCDSLEKERQKLSMTQFITPK